MNSYSIQPLLSKAVNLLTVEAVAAQHLFEKVANTTKSTILTTVEATTHTTYAEQLTKLSANPNIRVVPYY
jgi:phosphoglycerate-specific signal transduction histidine kinase